MHLFIELTTLAFFLVTVVHAGRTRGREGIVFFVALLALGLVRENAVVLWNYLYAFAPLNLMLGKAPLIAAIIWGYSIYLAVVWAETVSSARLGEGRPSGLLLLLTALFMIALAGFYEPFLETVGMSKWEEGTRRIAGVPYAALVGYPTLTAGFLLCWPVLLRKKVLGGALLLALALVHAVGLQALKSALDW